MKNVARTTIWLWLTMPIAILLWIAAGSELLFDGLFPSDTPYFVAQAIGQDVVTLAVALPALAISAILVSRGSERARLVWLGALVYVLYTYVIYAFQLHFNSLFLVYVALLGCSLYALIGGLATTDLAEIKARFTERTPVKAASILLAVVAILFYFAWLSELVPALVAGGVPQSVTQNGTPTNGVHVLDMAWILPAMGLAAFWLWRKQTLGYTLAGALLTFQILLVLAIISMTIFMARYDQSISGGQAGIFGIVGIVNLGMLVCYLRGLKEKSPESRSAARKVRLRRP
jgi:hypothetical protein